MTGAGGGDRERLGEVVVRCRAELVSFLGRHATPALLRYESPEDLAQGAISEALASAERFRWEGEAEARAWLFRVARRHAADRAEHWMALKRRSGPLLRFDATHSGGSAAREPAVTQTGPITFAFRREQLVLTTRALALLLPRDRDLMTWASQGVPLTEQAERLGLGYEAAGKAGQRAAERFRKAWELAARAARGGG